MGIKRYIIQFKNKETQNIQYFHTFGNGEYVIIDKIKYKKRTYILISDKDSAFYRKTMEDAQRFIDREIMNYRADLADKYDITAVEFDYPTNKLKPIELADKFFDFIFHLRNWMNSHKGYSNEAILTVLEKNGKHLLELGERLDYDDVLNMLNHVEENCDE